LHIEVPCGNTGSVIDINSLKAVWDMARALRITFEGAFYHVTSRGNERRAVFKSKRDREKFIEYLETATERYSALIHAYCLMDNHYHLLIETPVGNLSQIMRHINGAYTTYFNVKRARSGHLFQGRYKAILVEKDECAKELSRYIHLNPVRAKMIETPEDYPWSSYGSYIGKKACPEWLHRDFILDYFGRKVSASQKGYRKFVESLIDQHYESPLGDVVGSVLLGSQEFIDFIKEKFIIGRKPDKDLPALGQLAPRVSMLSIFEEVDSVFGEDPSFSRNLKIYLSKKHTGEKLKTIGSYFGMSESAVSHASRRAESQIAAAGKLKKKIRKIEKKLKLSNFKT